MTEQTHIDEQSALGEAEPDGEQQLPGEAAPEDDPAGAEAEPEIAVIEVPPVSRPEQPPTAAEPMPVPLDEVCAAAVDIARSAVTSAPAGEHLRVVAEAPEVVTHYFAADVPGYRGWVWAVSVTRIPGTTQVTICETSLLPDQDSLLAPAWVPWRERVQAEDVGAGDVVITTQDDPALVAGYTENDLAGDLRDDLAPHQWELGLGRVRMLSPQGRAEAAARWWRSETGPRATVARASKLKCGSCGFLLPLGGPLGQAFGVCAGELSPADGSVVALTYGCGAHSESVEHPTVAIAEMVIDELAFDTLPVDADDEGVTDEGAPAEDDVADESSAAEQHSGAPADADLDRAEVATGSPGGEPTGSDEPTGAHAQGEPGADSPSPQAQESGAATPTEEDA